MHLAHLFHKFCSAQFLQLVLSLSPISATGSAPFRTQLKAALQDFWAYLRCQKSLGPRQNPGLPEASITRTQSCKTGTPSLRSTVVSRVLRSIFEKGAIIRMDEWANDGKMRRPALLVAGKKGSDELVNQMDSSFDRASKWSARICYTLPLSIRSIRRCRLFMLRKCSTRL